MQGMVMIIKHAVKGFVFWDITPCIPGKYSRRFARIYCVHLRGKLSERNQQEASSCLFSFVACLSYFLTLKVAAVSFSVKLDVLLPDCTASTSKKYSALHAFNETKIREFCPKVTGKAIPLTGRGGPYGCETARFSHFLHSRLTDGGEVVSLTRRLPFIPQEYSWYSFILETDSIPGP
jgi:hypothetical protein